MKYISILLFVAFYSCSQTKTGNEIVLGNIDSINSKILGEERKIWIHVPSNRSTDTASKHHYPVVYLLDGDAHFQSVVGMIQQLSSVNGNTICPEMIVIGIPNTDRMRDLTPTHVDADLPYVDSNTTKTSGGGEKFTAFLEKELIPYIDSLYPTLPYRMYIGHSLGGLTVMNTLINHADLFNAYLAIDPSMWWDNQKLLTETETALANHSFSGKKLFLAIANTMSDAMDTARVQKDTSGITRHIRSILALDKHLLRNRQNQLTYMGRYYNNEDHGSVPLIAEYDALRFFFDFYRLKLTIDEQFDLNMSVVNKIENHYKEISKQFGYEFPVPEEYAKEMAYQALATKHFQEAEYLFKLNLRNYPGNANVYESMGDFYQTTGDKAKAIEHFEKALSMKASPELKMKLEQVKGK